MCKPAQDDQDMPCKKMRNIQFATQHRIGDSRFNREDKNCILNKSEVPKQFDLFRDSLCASSFCLNGVEIH